MYQVSGIENLVRPCRVIGRDGEDFEAVLFTVHCDVGAVVDVEIDLICGRMFDGDQEITDFVHQADDLGDR